MFIVFTTVPNAAEAESLADKIVSAKHAACVQILPQMRSVYWWNGEVQKESEHLLLIKTTAEKYDELEKFISANHSYEVPEIVAVDAAKVPEGYLKWLGQSLD